MAITIGGGIRARIREYRSSIVIQVQRASDVEVAEAALGRARSDIAGLDGGWHSAPGLSPGDRNAPTYVGNVVPTPAGPFLFIDGGYTPAELLATIPDIVARHLEAAGVHDAVIAFPLGIDTPLFKQGLVLDTLPRAAILHLYPPPAPLGSTPDVPEEWLEETASWVGEEFDGETGAWASALSVAFPVDRRDSLETLRQCRRSGIVYIVSGDLDRRIRVLSAEFRGSPPFALGAGGPTATDDELVAAIDDLAAVARHLAPTIGYAHISLRPTFLGLHTGTWRRIVLPGGLYGELLLDAMPWQILGPGHMRRLEAAGALPLERTGLARARPLPGGMVEVAIGDAGAWLPGSPHADAVLAHGRELLAPCLLGQAERDALRRKRRAEQERTDP